MEAELVFNDRVNIESKLTYDMEVLKDGISKIQREIIWSGTKYNGTQLLEAPRGYTISDSKRKQSPYLHTVYFNEEKKPGDSVNFVTSTSISDDGEEMSPVYSFMVKYQIDELVLHVVAPPGLITNVKKAAYADRGREINVIKPATITKENIGNLVRYTYSIKNPTILYNYFIEWEFTN